MMIWGIDHMRHIELDMAIEQSAAACGLCSHLILLEVIPEAWRDSREH